MIQVPDEANPDRTVPIDLTQSHDRYRQHQRQRPRNQMEVRALLIDPILNFPNSFEAHMPHVGENDEPNHGRNQEVVNQNKHHNTREILTGTGFRDAQRSILAADDVLPATGSELREPAKIQETVVVN